MALAHIAGVFLLVIALQADSVRAAGVIVAASNSLPEARNRATLLCDGADDQVELSASFSQPGGGTVEWLPGDYQLSGTVTVPAGANHVLQAAGSHLHYLPTTGDAVVIKGMFHSRMNFGVIECATTGAALRLQNEAGVNMLVSIVSFTGLVGHGRQGYGIVIDTSEEGISTNRIEGTDISGFDVGIQLPETLVGKIDTTWLWINSLRNCNTGIWEGNQRVDTLFFRVALHLDGTTAAGIRSGGKYDRVDLTVQGTPSAAASVITLASPAVHNVLFVRPTAAADNSSDQSGNATNVLLALNRTPYMEHALPLLSSVSHFECYE